MVTSSEPIGGVSIILKTVRASVMIFCVNLDMFPALSVVFEIFLNLIF